MIKNSINNNRCLLVLTGFTCNNNCIICSVKGKEKNYKDRSHEDIVGDLEKGILNGYEEVEFTGGEPTIRKDICALIARAKTMGYKTIALSTNGRLFSYRRFCDKAVATGLNKVTFSLLGSTKKIHNAITRTPGTYKEIIAGIKNAQRHDGLHINISTVISRLNHKDLLSFGKFVISLGVRNWYLLDLIPDGSAKISYNRLVVRLKDLYNNLNNLNAIADKFDELGFFDFPFCLFNSELRRKKNAMFVNSKMREEISRQVGYNPERITEDKSGKFYDVYRKNIKICEKCTYFKECGGIWMEYLELYGDKEIEDMARINGCLN